MTVRKVNPESHVDEAEDCHHCDNKPEFVIEGRNCPTCGGDMYVCRYCMLILRNQLNKFIEEINIGIGPIIEVWDIPFSDAERRQRLNWTLSRLNVRDQCRRNKGIDAFIDACVAREEIVYLSDVITYPYDVLADMLNTDGIGPKTTTDVMALVYTYRDKERKKTLQK